MRLSSRDGASRERATNRSSRESPKYGEFWTCMQTTCSRAVTTGVGLNREWRTNAESVRNRCALSGDHDLGQTNGHGHSVAMVAARPCTRGAASVSDDAALEGQAKEAALTLLQPSQHRAARHYEHRRDAARERFEPRHVKRDPDDCRRNCRTPRRDDETANRRAAVSEWLPCDGLAAVWIHCPEAKP